MLLSYLYRIDSFDQLYSIFSNCAVCSLGLQSFLFHVSLIQCVRLPNLIFGSRFDPFYCHHYDSLFLDFVFLWCCLDFISKSYKIVCVCSFRDTLSVLSVIQPLVVLSYTAVIGLSIVAYICVMSIISVIVHCFVTFYVYEIKPFWN